MSESSALVRAESSGCRVPPRFASNSASNSSIAPSGAEALSLSLSLSLSLPPSVSQS